MRHKKSYLQTHDLDYFFIKNGKYCHAASAGGKLPRNVDDVRNLRALQRLVNELPYVYKENEVIINRRHIVRLKRRVDKEFNLENYIDTFVKFARKGFYSYDRTNLEDVTDNQYHLVASPPYKTIIDIDISECNEYLFEEI